MYLKITNCPDNPPKVTSILMETLDINFEKAVKFYQMIKDDQVVLSYSRWNSFSTKYLSRCFTALVEIGCACNLSTGTYIPDKPSPPLHVDPGLPSKTAIAVIEEGKFLGSFEDEFDIDYSLMSGDYEHGTIWHKQDGRSVIYSTKTCRWYLIPKELLRS